MEISRETFVDVADERSYYSYLDLNKSIYTNFTIDTVMKAWDFGFSSGFSFRVSPRRKIGGVIFYSVK